MTVGTQAALLAGFAFAAVIEVNIQSIGAAEDSSDDFSSAKTALQVVWYLTTVAAMVLEIFALVKAMQLSILGPGLALRGPEGSMTRALVIMRTEYQRVHIFFYSGLCAFLASILLYSFAMLTHVANGALSALICAIIFLASAYSLFSYGNLRKQLRLPVQSGIPTVASTQSAAGAMETRPKLGRVSLRAPFTGTAPSRREPSRMNVVVKRSLRNS